MLNELDRELESRGLRFTRYADDVVIVLKSKAAATRVMYSKSVLTRAISKEKLTKRGLISLSDYYQKVAHI